MKKFLMSAILILIACMFFTPATMAVGPKPIHAWSTYGPYYGGETLDGYPWDQPLSAYQRRCLNITALNMSKPSDQHSMLDQGFYENMIYAIIGYRYDLMTITLNVLFSEYGTADRHTAILRR